MFSNAQVGEIRKRCPKDFEELLQELSISIDWNDGDEYDISEKFDEELEQKLSVRLKDKSVDSGYKSLMKLGEIPYSYKDNYSELLDKIVTNKDKILSSIKNQNVECNSWQEKYGNTSPGKERVETLNIEATSIRRFDVRGIISEFERVKSALRQNPGSSPFEGLERIIRLTDNLPTNSKSSVVNAMSVFLQEICKFSQTSKCDNLNEVLRAIDICISRLEKLNNLFESDLSSSKIFPLEDIQEQIQKISRKLRDNERGTVCLIIKKNVEMRDKKIPPKPPEPKFTVNEAEEAIRILERLNEIVKQIEG